MSNVTQVIKTIELDLTNIPEEDIKKAKKRAGDFLVNSILREVGNGKSPVEGEKFKKLQKKYAEKEHNGRRLPILEVEGDMLEALKHKGANNKTAKLEVGIEGSQAPKADGHNQLSDEAIQWALSTDRVQYRRRFIPDTDQKFKANIRRGVDEILDSFRVSPVREETTEDEEASRTFTISTVDEGSQVTTPERTRVTSSEFFSDDIIEELLNEAIRKRDR